MWSHVLSRPDGYIAWSEADSATPALLGGNDWTVTDLPQEGPGCVAPNGVPAVPEWRLACKLQHHHSWKPAAKYSSPILQVLTRYTGKEAPKYAIELFWVYLNKIAEGYSCLINIETTSWKKLQTIPIPIKWTVKSLPSSFIIAYIQRLKIAVDPSSPHWQSMVGPQWTLLFYFLWPPNLPLSCHHQLPWRCPSCRTLRSITSSSRLREVLTRSWWL